jgi:hypothetical protein
MFNHPHRERRPPPRYDDYVLDQNSVQEDSNTEDEDYNPNNHQQGWHPYINDEATIEIDHMGTFQNLC